MKTLIILVCFVVANVQSAAILREMLGNAITECKDKVQATPDDILQVLQHQPLSSTPAKCLVSCLSKKFKIQTPTGEIDIEATKETMELAKYISEDVYQKVSAIADKCLSQVHTGDNECDIAYSFFSCSANEAVAAKLPILLADL